jgi:hypothetical protein
MFGYMAVNHPAVNTCSQEAGPLGSILSQPQVQHFVSALAFRDGSHYQPGRVKLTNILHPMLLVPVSRTATTAGTDPTV